MRLIIDPEGAVLNVKGVCWEAYRRAVKEIGLACADQPTFWRLLRTGAPSGQLVRHAREPQLRRYEAAFAQHLRDDDVLALATLHEDAVDALRALTRRHEVVYVVAGESLDARQALWRRLGLPGPVQDVQLLTDDISEATGRMADLARTPDRSVVVCASLPVCQAAVRADITTVGITSGTAVGRRLAGGGAVACYSSLADFAEALASGDEPLVRAGLALRQPRR